MRQLNTWMQPYDIDSKPLMNAKFMHRLATKMITSTLMVKVEMLHYKSMYKVESGQEELCFADGSPMAYYVNYGKSKIYLLGFSYMETRDKAWQKLIGDILKDTNIEKYEFSD